MTTKFSIIKIYFVLILLISLVLAPKFVQADESPDQVGDRVFNECSSSGGGDRCGEEAAAAYNHRAREIIEDGNKEERDQLAKEEEAHQAQRDAAANGTTTQTTTAATTATSGTQSTATGTCREGDYETDCNGTAGQENVFKCGPDGHFGGIAYVQNNPACTVGSTVTTKSSDNKCLTGEATAAQCDLNKSKDNGDSAIKPTGGCSSGDWQTGCVGDGSATEDAFECVNKAWVRRPRQNNPDCVPQKRGASVDNKLAQEGTALYYAQQLSENPNGCLGVGNNSQGDADKICGVIYGVGASCNAATKECNLPIKPKDQYKCVKTTVDSDGSEFCKEKIGGGTCSSDGFCVGKSATGCNPVCNTNTQTCDTLDRGRTYQCVKKGTNSCGVSKDGKTQYSYFYNYTGDILRTSCDADGCTSGTGLCKNFNPNRILAKVSCAENQALKYEYKDGSVSYKACQVDGIFTVCNAGGPSRDAQCGTLSDIATINPDLLPKKTVKPTPAGEKCLAANAKSGSEGSSTPLCSCGDGSLNKMAGVGEQCVPIAGKGQSCIILSGNLGAALASDSDNCDKTKGLTCQNGTCAENKKPDGAPCTSSGECSIGICMGQYNSVTNSTSGQKYCGAATSGSKCYKGQRDCNANNPGHQYACNESGQWVDDGLDTSCGAVTTGAKCDPKNPDSNAQCAKTAGNTCLPTNQCGKPSQDILSCAEGGNPRCTNPAGCVCSGCLSGSTPNGGNCVSKTTDGGNCGSSQDCRSGVCSNWVNVPSKTDGKYCGNPPQTTAPVIGKIGGACNLPVGSHSTRYCDVGDCDTVANVCK